MSDLVTAALRGDFAAARAVHYRVLPLLLGNFMESNPIPVKTACTLQPAHAGTVIASASATMTTAVTHCFRILFVLLASNVELHIRPTGRMGVP